MASFWERKFQLAQGPAAFWGEWKEERKGIRVKTGHGASAPLLSSQVDRAVGQISETHRWALFPSGLQVVPPAVT